MKIKFCGLFRECDIDYANALMPDFVGFVFVEKSKRFVDFGVAKGLKSNLDSRIKAVGVFVDSPIETISNAVREKIIDIVQLHGSEDNGYIGALRESLRQNLPKSLCKSTQKSMAQNPAHNDLGAIAPIIKAIKMRDSRSLNEALESSADFILLDSTNAGSGKAFEWNLLTQKLQDSRDLQSPNLLQSNNADSKIHGVDSSANHKDSQHFAHNFHSRFFLAGGINADNLPQAMSLNPYAIDISSGIESDGVKDFTKMQHIIESIRAVR